mmetsp:Transcript_81248/g.262641  ORF Transcript_81248/g.262641 Transcript_81248/m.262641 type:complete len:238 (-) Transcript_81248:414-1127(-)
MDRCAGDDECRALVDRRSGVRHYHRVQKRTWLPRGAPVQRCGVRPSGHRDRNGDPPPRAAARRQTLCFSALRRWATHRCSARCGGALRGRRGDERRRAGGAPSGHSPRERVIHLEPDGRRRRTHDVDENRRHLNPTLELHSAGGELRQPLRSAHGWREHRRDYQRHWGRKRHAWQPLLPASHRQHGDDDHPGPRLHMGRSLRSVGRRVRFCVWAHRHVYLLARAVDFLVLLLRQAKS